ncbi:hypothetical protein DFJ74DRAFT_637115 [Hyaloraphidium curvatum]|nr:hypothetical protein DFJ74DRAFT_637115 [Hyaloraphidium curvatum]
MAPVAWMIRDKLARQFVQENEVMRQALRFIVRDTEQPAATRRRAQLALNTYPRITRRHAVKDKCIEHGRSKGVIMDYKINRMLFREQALNGDLPGVIKARFS